MRSLVLNTPGKPRQVKEVGHQQWMHAMYVNLSVQVIYVNARRTFALHQASSWRLLAKESNLSTQKLGCVLSEMVQQHVQCPCHFLTTAATITLCQT